MDSRAITRGNRTGVVSVDPKFTIFVIFFFVQRYNVGTYREFTNGYFIASSSM